MSVSGSVNSALAPLDRAPTWLNTEPLTADALRGRVVAVDFWTYSCVNWLRTLPYVRAWAEKYADHELVVVGVHAPEFGFEHDLANVRDAIADLDVRHPVVVDNDFAIWRAFDNHYWPALYLVDREGRIRYHHFGEEAYGEIERSMQELLGIDADLVHVEPDGLTVAAAWDTLRSPETYVGAARGAPRNDLDADELALNQWSLAGRWNVGPEAAVLDEPGGAIAFRFEARDVNLVMARGDDDVRFTLALDGEPPGDDRGLDVLASGAGTVTGPRMYQLVRQSGRVRQRTVEITFDEPGVRAYVFTFG